MDTNHQRECKNERGCFAVPKVALMDYHLMLHTCACGCVCFCVSMHVCAFSGCIAMCLLLLLRTPRPYWENDDIRKGLSFSCLNIIAWFDFPWFLSFEHQHDKGQMLNLDWESWASFKDQSHSSGFETKPACYLQPYRGLICNVWRSHRILGDTLLYPRQPKMIWRTT